MKRREQSFVYVVRGRVSGSTHECALECSSIHVFPLDMVTERVSALSINFLWKAGEGVAQCMVGVLQRVGEVLYLHKVEKKSKLYANEPSQLTKLGPSCSNWAI